MLQHPKPSPTPISRAHLTCSHPLSPLLVLKYFHRWQGRSCTTCSSSLLRWPQRCFNNLQQRNSWLCFCFCIFSINMITFLFSLPLFFCSVSLLFVSLFIYQYLSLDETLVFYSSQTTWRIRENSSEIIQFGCLLSSKRFFYFSSLLSFTTCLCEVTWGHSSGVMYKSQWRFSRPM